MRGAAGFGGILLWTWCVAPAFVLPDGLLAERGFRAQRPLDAPLLVTPEKPLRLAAAVFGDHDLRLEFELDAGAELDVVLRKAEPRGHLLGTSSPFHGRFAVLRLSTQRTGTPWRSRDDVLFGDDAGGAQLRSQARHELGVRARGHWLDATLDGAPLGAHAVADVWGDLALVVRGGPEAAARIFDLAIEPTPALWFTSRNAALLTGWLLIAALAWHSVGALLVLLGGALIARWIFVPELATWAVPSGSGAWLALAWGLPVAAALVLRRRWLLVPGVLLAGVMLAGACYVEAPRLTRAADPRLDLHFGARSGEAPFHALACLIEGARGVATLGDPQPRVLLLGGRQFWNPFDDPIRSAPGKLEGIFAAQRPKPSVADTGTVLANCHQQYLLFRHHLLRYRPAVVVFGISAFEALPDLPATARTMAAEVAPPSPLRVLLPEPVPSSPPSTPPELVQTLDELHALCAREQSALILATQEGLPEPYLQVVQQFARRSATPLCERVMAADGSAEVTALAAAIQRALAR